jgi:hypothetical protein
MIEITETKFYNPGLLEADMPLEAFQDLTSFTNEQLKNKDVNYAMKRALFTDSTVSGIEESIIVNAPPQSFKNFIFEFSEKYVEYFKVSVGNQKPILESSWLNLQKRYEYRPAHCHDNSSNLSFVTYIKIPYNAEDEEKYSNHYRAKIFRNGKIEFFYNSLNGFQKTFLLNIDKTFEGKTILFPSSLMHIVYPFYTSTDYRISLAGNIKFV